MTSPLTIPSWEDIAPRFTELQNTALTAATIPGWLDAWSAAEKAVWEARAWLKRAHLRDLTNVAEAQAYQHFMATVFPPYRAATQALITKLLAVPGYQPLPQHAGFVRNWRADAALYRVENAAVQAEIDRLQEAYHDLIWSARVPFEDQMLTPSEVTARDGMRERDRRAALWHAKHAVWQNQHDALSQGFLDLVRQRQQLARNAGFADYRAYRWQEVHRFDFTPADCLAFYEAATEAFSAMAARMAERRKHIWQVDALQPWDWQIDTDPASSEQIFANEDDMLDAVGGVCARLDPAFGTLFARMRAQGFVDLGTRPGKPGGGEEWYFPLTELPAVRVATTGTLNDVLLCLHECGHAWHDHLSATTQGLFWSLGGPAGFDEFPSVAMPFLGMPQCAVKLGGFASQAQLEAMQVREHERILLRWLPEIVRAERFQHWAYTRPADQVRPADLDAQWLALTQQCLPWIDWAGQATDVALGWQRVGLLFSEPFYFTEYALAQVAGLQLAQRARTDAAATWTALTAALLAGNTRTLPELYALQGIALPFEQRGRRDALKSWAP